MGLHGIERHEVLKLAEDEEVERSLAEQVLKVSVYWYEHPSGVPVNAPGHVKRIYSAGRKHDERMHSLGFAIEKKSGTKRNDWKIDFGANTFSISKAISRCQAALIEFLNAAEQVDDAKAILVFWCKWYGKIRIDRPLKAETLDLWSISLVYYLIFKRANANMEEIKKTLCVKVRQSVENSEGYEYDLYPISYDNHMIFGATSICIDAFINFIIQKCQTFKKINRLRSAVCPLCMKSFNNNRDLKYHHQVVHYGKRR